MQENYHVQHEENARLSIIKYNTYNVTYAGVEASAATIVSLNSTFFNPNIDNRPPEDFAGAVVAAAAAPLAGGATQELKPEVSIWVWYRNPYHLLKQSKEV
jgi:hypothetical protein